MLDLKNINHYYTAYTTKEEYRDYLEGNKHICKKHHLELGDVITITHKRVLKEQTNLFRVSEILDDVVYLERIR